MWCSHVMFTCDCCIIIFQSVIFEQKPACDVHMWFWNVFLCDVHMWCSHVFYSTVISNFGMWCSHVISTCDFWYVMFTCDFKNNHIRFPDEMMLLMKTMVWKYDDIIFECSNTYCSSSNFSCVLYVQTSLSMHNLCLRLS